MSRVKIITMFLIALLALLSVIGCSASPSITSTTAAPKPSTTAAAPGTTSAAPAPSTSAAVPTTTTAAPTTTVASNWKPEKVVSIIVPHAPGTGYDVYTRGITQIMSPKYVPQTIIIKNVPGAGGNTGSVQIYRSKPDGYTLGIVDLERRVMDTVGGGTNDWDLTKFTLIAACNKTVGGVVVGKNSPYKTIDDLVAASKDKIMHIACNDIGGTEALAPVLLGMDKYAYISGFAGSADSMLALVKNEAEFSVFSDTVELPFILSGDVRPLLFFGDKPSASWEAAGIHVPCSTDIKNPALAGIGGERVFLGPPGIPANIQAYWENAFMSTMKDQALLDWSKKSLNPIDATSSKDVLAFEKALIENYTKYQDILAKYK